MSRLKLLTLALATLLFACKEAPTSTPTEESTTPSPTPTTQRWTPEAANTWYSQQPWLAGCNYAPATAINQLEMFQAETFDTARINTELGWAASLGLNTMRVFLHDLLWEQDTEGFKKRLDTFLALCQRHGIKPMLVLFDSCWDPRPALGKQHEPVPGVHNSGWVQSPGAAALQDTAQYQRLEAYVKGIVGAFKSDDRILAWDVWNEPDNVSGKNVYGEHEPANKVELVEKLLPRVFEWARAAQPTQPLTSGVWEHGGYDWSSPDKYNGMEKVQLENSDFITFHTYSDSATFRRNIQYLKALGRPLICTEYLARGNKSTFETFLPIAKAENVGMVNWGFVQGKLQTELPWDSWDKPYVGGHKLPIWHHEILKTDGSPYRQAEVDLIKQTTGKTIK